MTGSNIAQAYRQARQNLIDRLGEIEAEVAEIKASLGLSATAAPRPRPRRGAPPPRAGASAGKQRKPGTGLFAILRHINEKGPLKPAALAEATGITYGTVSTALNTLRQRQHATPSAKGWTLTPAGKANLAKRARLLS